MLNLSGTPSALSSAELSQSAVSSRNTSSAKGIRHAAGEFEAILLNQWLESAESTFGTVPGGDDEDAGDAQMKSFAVQALAKGITAAGGIGLASLVSTVLEKPSGGVQTQAADPATEK